ncbi:glycosyltransferase family 2 protein [Candidatus Woesebacteria bacterium]|nr:glycosyltransferase family 2 protein [Candidatus Woesebacteria bacterium]
MPEHIAIITVVYKNYTVLEDFFASLSAQKEKNFYVFIADASPDKQEIQPRDFPLTVIPVQNKGYAHGVNIGIKKAQEMGITRFCVINDDTLFESDFTEKISAAFESHPGAALGGKIYYAEGCEYHKNKYSENDKNNVLWYAGGVIDWKHAQTKHLGVDKVDHGEYNTVKETEFITGCLFCFDQEVVNKVGLWDEKYFLYYEDADFSERVKRTKLPLRYNPDIVIWHKNAQSSDGSGSQLHVKLQKESHLRFALKYAPLRTKIHVLKNYFI